MRTPVLLRKRPRRLLQLVSRTGSLSNPALRVFRRAGWHFVANGNDRPLEPLYPTLSSYLGFVYGYLGAPERMLEREEEAAKNGTLIAQSVWRQSAAPLRKTERFKALIRNAGLVDCWRVRGWPDFCRPIGTHDFICDWGVAFL
jgi:hypothetical protein